MVPAERETAEGADPKRCRTVGGGGTTPLPPAEIFGVVCPVSIQIVDSVFQITIPASFGRCQSIRVSRRLSACPFPRAGSGSMSPVDQGNAGEDQGDREPQP